MIRGDARELTKFWPVIQNMVTQELRIRYHRSVLGFLWTLINPILMMTTLTLVFSQVFDRAATGRQYAIYLFAGQVPWALFAGSLTDCSHCIVGQRGPDPEDLPAEADLPAGQGPDQPDDVRPLAGGALLPGLAARARGSRRRW